MATSKSLRDKSYLKELRLINNHAISQDERIRHIYFVWGREGVGVGVVEGMEGQPPACTCLAKRFASLRVKLPQLFNPHRFNAGFYRQQ